MGLLGGRLLDVTHKTPHLTPFINELQPRHSNQVHSPAIEREDDGRSPSNEGLNL